jgi:hypothetical protein
MAKPKSDVQRAADDLKQAHDEVAKPGQLVPDPLHEPFIVWLVRDGCAGPHPDMLRVCPQGCRRIHYPVFRVFSRKRKNAIPWTKETLGKYMQAVAKKALAGIRDGGKGGWHLDIQPNPACPRMQELPFDEPPRTAQRDMLDAMEER